MRSRFGRAARHFFGAGAGGGSAFSIAAVTSFAEGAVFGSKRAASLPSVPTRNLVKFHLISPAKLGSVSLSVRYLYIGWMPSPFTTIFANIGKVTLYFEEQNSLISALVPGSCAPNSLAGKPRTTRPRSL